MYVCEMADVTTSPGEARVSLTWNIETATNLEKVNHALRKSSRPRGHSD
jgi:hypothetical protein